MIPFKGACVLKRSACVPKSGAPLTGVIGYNVPHFLLMYLYLPMFLATSPEYCYTNKNLMDGIDDPQKERRNETALTKVLEKVKKNSSGSLTTLWFLIQVGNAY